MMPAAAIKGAEPAMRPPPRSVQSTLWAAAALVMACVALIVLPACSVLLVRRLHVPPPDVLAVTVPAAVIVLAAALGMAHLSRRLCSAAPVTRAASSGALPTSAVGIEAPSGRRP